MCGRFVITEAADEMARLFEAIPANDLPQVPNHNVCPTNQILVVLGGEGRRLTSMRWGFIPHWYKSPGDGPLLINARAETIAEKPAFRSAARERRCIVPATGFYEWTKDADNKRLPWYIRPSGGGPIAFAAIWQEWRHGDDLMNTCAIVTTSANAAMAKIHHRMPVCLSPEDWPLWLGEAGKGAAMLMRPAPESYLDFWRVDPRVNSNRASGCDLIEPISA
ncbi:SOS response-associated peptidase [Ovoidimarina sediminis]|uniref:SOS response-associated peptidase n=1 Tax=Ovoidimarina sediminis TaxID=3079856 RepID=UPI00290C68E2|nr:SOS response-associated peptidase [Rhodophyticola sp. MJ-SS7]MDU8942162.1 SOS response-associated peptidase [Rhodophyticola sp. MJ-SS7]